MYLPQYHEIDENNRWWGKGYTEWTAVKRAKPLFKGHVQPKVPLNNNYYDLSDKTASTWKWQAELAVKYGVYGFCIYYYWSNGKQLLHKPLEILFDHPEIQINYCLCWANESWTRTWYGLEKEILMKQEYGSKEDWEKHFKYLLKFFKDNRYIKVNNKPMLNIYRSSDIEKLDGILDSWNKLAKKNGFDGIYIVASNNNGDLEKRDDLVDAYYNFEPGYTLKHKLSIVKKLYYSINVFIRRMINRVFKFRMVEHVIDAAKLSKIMSKRIDKTKKPVFKGAFTMWDNTPRRSYEGLIYKNTTPELFYQTLKNIGEAQVNEELDYVYVNAWNEWGEGCYLEPDTTNKYQYLEAIKKTQGH